MPQPKIDRAISIDRLAGANLSFPQIDLRTLMACNALQSQALGRRVFKIHQDGKTWWLKGQLRGVNALSEQAFLHELEVYKALSSLHVGILLPFQFFKPIQHSIEPTQNIWLEQGLLLQDAPALFDSTPEILSRDQIIHILLQSLMVLNELHDVGWLHGDLKVEHFRKNHTQPYLIDFEQAHLIGEVLAQTSATPRYMAPELFHGEGKTVQSDLYALGIIWLQWLTQQKLSEKSYLDWAYLHCQHLNVHLPPQFLYLIPVLNAMLAKHKQQRCTNIYQIKQILSDIV